MGDGFTNRLIDEKSPYLRQHAHNPVDWHPWGDETFALARRNEKPIFLSIGYSTCHWCHVMERETFADASAAALINRAFIPVKVDREERPDLDGLYMLVCQLMTGRGGWPLTIIMTPEKNPFFAATYIPKKSRHGNIGIVDLVPRIEDLWINRRNDIYSSAQGVMDAVKSMDIAPGRGDYDETVLHTAFYRLSSLYDEDNGGFGTGNKFPNIVNLLYLMSYWKKTGSSRAMEIVRSTLRAMRRGGIFDHVGLGYHRYAVDPEWKVPHFEKMLYDQAMIAMAFNQAYLAFRDDEFKRSCIEVLDFVLDSMTSPDGGFYTALDADSAEGEGAFYLWKYDALSEILRSDTDLFTRHFNVRREGNFTESGGEDGLNVLFLEKNSTLPADYPDRRLQRCLAVLSAERNRRNRPFRDEKILADWNGLMIASLSQAGKSLGEEKYISAARKAARFITAVMTRNGVLHHRFMDGDLAIEGFIDDYAFTAMGLLELYGATYDGTFLAEAMKLSDAMAVRFGGSGAFLYSSIDSNVSPYNRSEVYDGVTPSGNTVAIATLLRLGRMTGRMEYESRASDALARLYPGITAHPLAYLSAIMAAEYNRDSTEVVISTNGGDEDEHAMMKVLNEGYYPRLTVIKSDDAIKSLIPDSELLFNYGNPLLGKTTAYICSNHTCMKPVHDPGEFKSLLDAHVK